MISPRIAPLAVALALTAPLLPVVAMADDTRSGLQQDALELKAANDAGQVKEGPAYGFGQSLPVFDLAPERSSLYGAKERLTPSYGTSASFPALTYRPIPETQSTFGLSIDF